MTAPDVSTTEDVSHADDTQPFFSQPESHVPASPTRVHGPSPRPSAPVESTPRRSSSSVFVDAPERPPTTDVSAQTHRNTSGAFTKLSELKPSALRRSVSRQEGPQAPASSIETVPSESESESESESDTESESDSGTDSDESSQPALPASKMAGASAAASAENASSAKRKRTFFSALS